MSPVIAATPLHAHAVRCRGKGAPGQMRGRRGGAGALAGVCLILAMIVQMAGCGGMASAQGLTALAKVDPVASALHDRDRSVELTLALSQPVPFRVFTLDQPRRLVLDFSEVSWDGLRGAGFDNSAAVTELRMGRFRPGWSRMVLRLARPLAISAAGMRTDAGAMVSVRLDPVSAAAFKAASGAPPSAVFALPAPVMTGAQPHSRQTGDRPVVVMLDPGHGGIDPGAERDGVTEADLMLTFGRELRDLLRRAGGFEVMMTRDSDVFVPLEMRQSMARAAGADVFISLHADALAAGRARGATIYTLAEDASDTASAQLAERHDRADLLAGVDLSRQDDVIAGVLMDMARTETLPRAGRLADALVTHLGEAIGGLYKRPRLEAAFSVLKAPDIPSVLIELGFISTPRDLARLQSEKWRARAGAGIVTALRSWAAADAAEALLLRK